VFEVVGEAALTLKRRLTPAVLELNFAEPGKRWWQHDEVNSRSLEFCRP